MISLFLSIPLTLISVIGLLLNTYILIVVLLTRQVRTANNILLFHLGSVDILLGILVLIFSIPGIKGAEWSTAGVPCIIHGFLFTLLHPLALWTICGLNCDRYYVIAAPLHYSHIVSPRKVVLGLGAGWVISFLLCIPPLFTVAPYIYNPGIGACGPGFSTGVGTLWYSTLYTAFTLLLPATVIICCNFKILMIARYHRHRIASAIYEVTLSAQVTITHQRNPFFVPTVTAPNSGGPKFKSRSAIYTVFQLVASFLILYVPYYTTVMWDAALGPLNNRKDQATMYAIASSLLVSSVPVNAFLYGVRSKILRKALKNYWRKKQTKSEVNQEIQARTPSTCGSRRPSLTPLGFLTKPSIQRRLSETLIDVNRALKSPSKGNKIKRISSEATWRPPSSNSLNMSPKDEYDRHLVQTTSCNTLQVPSNETEVSAVTEEEIYIKLKDKSSPTKYYSANAIIQKFLGLEQQDKSVKKATAVLKNVSEKVSPRILITRAMSEENDRTSNASTPKKEMLRQNTSLMEKWKQMQPKDNETSHQDTTTNISLSNRSSESSDLSESSSSRQYRRSSAEVENEVSEEQLLLWDTQKKYVRNEDVRKAKSLLMRQSLVVHSPEIVL
nr:unnamed protein product [Callosobruchus analis]